MNSIPDVKFVIFDISSEYGINILDLLRSLPSRIVLTEPLPNYGNDNYNAEKVAEDYLVRHVVPEALMDSKKELTQVNSTSHYTG